MLGLFAILLTCSISCPHCYCFNLSAEQLEQLIAYAATVQATLSFALHFIGYAHEIIKLHVSVRRSGINVRSISMGRCVRRLEQHKINHVN